MVKWSYEGPEYIIVTAKHNDKRYSWVVFNYEIRVTQALDEDNGSYFSITIKLLNTVDRDTQEYKKTTWHWFFDIKLDLTSK